MSSTNVGPADPQVTASPTRTKDGGVSELRFGAIYIHVPSAVSSGSGSSIYAFRGKSSTSTFYVLGLGKQAGENPELAKGQGRGGERSSRQPRAGEAPVRFGHSHIRISSCSLRPRKCRRHCCIYKLSFSISTSTTAVAMVLNVLQRVRKLNPPAAQQASPQRSAPTRRHSSTAVCLFCQPRAQTSGACVLAERSVSASPRVLPEWGRTWEP